MTTAKEIIPRKYELDDRLNSQSYEREATDYVKKRRRYLMLSKEINAQKVKDSQ